jgi:hypothetical protein
VVARFRVKKSQIMPKTMLCHPFLVFLNPMFLFMKKLMVLLVTLVLFTATEAQTAAPSTQVLLAKETAHDFGKIPQGKPVYTTFTLVNKSNATMKLDNVSASCGCTTPEWSKAPIAPGASTAIKVGYNAADSGPFERFITVQYNSGQTIQMSVKGHVWTPPAGAAPLNASVLFLKQQTQ